MPRPKRNDIRLVLGAPQGLIEELDRLATEVLPRTLDGKPQSRQVLIRAAIMDFIEKHGGQIK